MPQDDSHNEEQKPCLPPAEDDSVAAEAPEKKEAVPAAAETEHPSDLKNAVRKKATEHKDNKDHFKIKTLKAEIEELKKEVERRAEETGSAREAARTAQKEILEWKDKTLRTLAETDNLRKRLEREKNEYFQFALSDVLKDVLHAIDNLERALQVQDTTDGFREGIELICKQMIDLVAKRGVTPIERPDGRFDPTVHQALVTEEAEGIEEPMVGEELQKGYMLNDRLLRPALVKVLLPKKD
ncbi:MAG: nucleotide exchange factor GrpE [Candidatus Aminicenantes bacterium]|nr:nucleotide exchange factor GrpE [Candidatus Aminicenantes bacterium]